MGSILDNKGLVAENIAINETLYVGGSGSGNYTSIQDAIDGAEKGDKIFIYNGIYYENIIIQKSIDITGENKNTTIVDGNKNGNVLNLTADWVNISNLMIKNSGIGNVNQSYTGIYVRNSKHISITNSVISECEIPLNIHYSYNVDLQHCKIFNNTGGVTFFKSINNSIGYCDISQCNSANGISLSMSSYNIVSNCKVSSNAGSGIAIIMSSNNTITNNTFWDNNAYGINIVRASGNQTSQWNTIYENNFVGSMINAHDGYNNSWDDGRHGNYWDDYNGIDSNDDGIGDTPYILYGNQDRYPLMEPIRNTLNITIKQPSVAIVYPKNNTITTGNIVIKGNASSVENPIEIVQVKIEGGEWHIANGTVNWTFEWNTTNFENGLYKIYARSTDGQIYSKVEHITINVQNKIKENNEDTSTPGFELITLIGVILGFLIITKVRK